MDTDYGLQQQSFQHTSDYKERSYNFWKWLMNWTLSSPVKLRTTERLLLSRLKSIYYGYFVDIGPIVGQLDQIWTVSVNAQSKEIPIVVLHGLGAGLALWMLNLDDLSRDRPIYAIDMLGFGRSSRSYFSCNPDICERQFVETIEQWRREVKIEKMLLVGHSMGAFIASSYALTYPERVKHLILVDAWGFPPKPAGLTKQIPLWVRFLGRFSLMVNPFWILRAVGPFGPLMTQVMNPEIMQKFTSILCKEVDILTQYLHQCNARTPTGEAAFHTMSDSFAFAKLPMLHRIKFLRQDIPITFIYGENSWVNPITGRKVKYLRPNSRVDLFIIKEAGHHVHIEQPEVFNDIVNKLCAEHNTNKTLTHHQQQQGIVEPKSCNC